jgi:hypothetical protein
MAKSKPFKKTNYTKFNDLEGANDYARSNEKDLQNLFQYIDDMGVTQTITISGTTLEIVNGIITKVS